MLRPVPCSALSEPSYLSTTSVADVVHEARIAVDLGCVGEILREDKVQIAFKRMAKDDALAVAVLAHQGLQVQRGGGQRLHRKGHVFNDHGGAGAAHRSDRREGALAHFPVHLAGGGVGGKRRRLDGGDAIQRCQRGVHAQLQGDRCFGAHLNQQAAAASSSVRMMARQAGFVLHRAQGGAVQQFHR